MTAPDASAGSDDAVHGLILLGEVVGDCNERFCAILGRGRAEIVGRPFLELCPDVQADGAFSSERWQRRWQAARAGFAQWFPWQFHDPQGGKVHALVHLSAEAGTDGLLKARVHDLSRLRYMHWEKPESQARLQDVLDHSKAVIFVKDLEGRYVFANRELERAVRIPAEAIIGRTDREIWPPELAERFRADDAQVLRERAATEFEVVGTVNGQRMTFGSFKFPLFGPDGEPYAVCGIATDITERRRTQDALTSAALAVSSAQGATVFQELVRYLATILETDAALITTPSDEKAAGTMRVHAFFLDGEIRENFEYPLAGTPCEAVVGQRFRIFPSGLRERFASDLDLQRMGLESYAGFPLSDSKGAPLGLISVMSRRPMVNAEFLESILKIFAVRAAAELERQHSEEVLRRSEASYRAVFESSVDAIFIHDWDTGAVVDVNGRACEVYGYSHDEMLGIDMVKLSSGIPPYTGEEAARWVQKAKAEGPVRVEWHRRNRDGSLHWDEVVLRPAIIAGRRRVLAFTREITERKEAEQALRQAQKMEALGHLTGGMAHDFNNLLTSIMGYIVLAAEAPGAAADARLAKYLEQAQLSCTRARDLIRQMLTFSRGQRGEPRPVSLPELVGHSVKLFGSSLPSTIDIRTTCEREVAAVMLDPVQLDQVLLNLCLNAKDAMSGVGTIRLGIASVHGGGRQCTACRKSFNGDYVELSVEDSGSGIAPEVVDRMFEPFFTTKDVGRGSGMGLASVHGIVHELGGHIVVDTAPGSGARFRVLLPALAPQQDEAGRNAPSAARTATVPLAGRVLIVDDDRSVSAFMRALLESWGITAKVANSGPEALSLFQRNRGACDLVITDQAMPRMTGIELTRKLIELRPGLPVLLYTGFSEGIPRAEIDSAGLRAVITKPVDPHELYGLLRTWLPQGATTAPR